MSTFLGKIKHFPLVSLDRFDGNNLESEAFLLSHCHEVILSFLYEYDNKV